ncbi:arsenate reductase ArsC [Microbulbifer donghaiensis]|nr:arsenate reductase ArsC [Microbulbifer donghaiensis]
MAEALRKKQAGDRFDVFSAGTSPGEIDPFAVSALERLGVDASGLRPKSLDTFAGEPFDFVISLCDKASLECEPLALGERFMAWNFEDPKSRGGPNPYNVTLNEISERIKLFLLVIDKEVKA